jgi:hypothetical protein
MDAPITLGFNPRLWESKKKIRGHPDLLEAAQPKALGSSGPRDRSQNQKLYPEV